MTKESGESVVLRRSRRRRRTTTSSTTSTTNTTTKTTNSSSTAFSKSPNKKTLLPSKRKTPSCSNSNCTIDHHNHHQNHNHNNHYHDHDPGSPIGVDEGVVGDKVNTTELLKITIPSTIQTQHQSQVSSGVGDQAQVLFVNELSGLTQIHKEEVQLAVWRQRSVPNFVTQLADPSIIINAEDLPVFEGIVLADEEKDNENGEEKGGAVAQYLKERLWVPYKLRSHEKRKRALDEGGIDELVELIDRLVQVFYKIAKDAGYLYLGAEEEEEGSKEEEGMIFKFVNVKLVAEEGNGCAYWHQDSVPFRMVATFRGPCTEWVPPAFSRETLEQRKMISKHAQSLTHCDVALFKGRGITLEGGELLDQPGIVHRSPQIEGSGICRLVLVIDIPQEGWHF